MADFYQKITDMQGSLEDLVRKVPGFKGYFERQDRRAADALLREQLVRRFEEQLGEFSQLQKRLIDASGLKYMERVQGIDTRIRTFIDKVGSAPQGYAGLFDVMKVNEDALKRVYAFDNALFAYLDQLATGLHLLAETIPTGEVEAVLGQLENLAAELNNVIARRVEAFQGAGDSV